VPIVDLNDIRPLVVLQRIFLMREKFVDISRIHAQRA